MIEPMSVGTLLLQGALVVAVVEGIRRRDVSAAVNAAVALGAAAFPGTVEFVLALSVGRDVGFGPELPLWIATAGVLHALGMLGLYESVWWWDHLAHTVSAGLVAALVYAGVVVVGRQPAGPGLPSGGAVAVTVAFVFGVGVLWELAELAARDVGTRYGIEPILVHYGWRDTALDLVFDLVGALLVVLLDLRVFLPVAERYPNATEVALLWTGGIVVAGSVVLAVLVGYHRDDGARSA